MNYISITKYDPVYRVEGKYIKDEWTSFSDVGKEFDNLKLSLRDYLSAEEKYISALFLIFKYFKCKSVRLINIYKNDNQSIDKLDSALVNTYLKIEEKEYELDLNRDEFFFKNIIMLTLREALSNSLEIYLDENNFIEFGYDYYMYLCTNKEDLKDVFNQIRELGLFIH